MSYKSSKFSNGSTGRHWPQYVATFAASVGMFGASLHQGWPAASIPKLLSDEYPFDISNEVVSYITVVGFVGSTCGAFSNLLLDKIGRKTTVLLMAVPQLISYSLIALSYYSVELLYLARIFGGISEGVSNCGVAVYVAEIADPEIRGRLSSLLAIVFYTGVLFANIVGSYVSIQNAALIYLLFPTMFLVFFWKMPESPYFLLIKAKHQEAEKSLKFLRWKHDVDAEMADLRKDVDRQMSETGTFRDIFVIDSNRRALFVSTGARFFQVTTGAAAFNLYMQVLLANATQSLQSHVGTSIILLIQVFMTVVATLIVDRWGRKPLLLFSVCGCSLNLFVQSIYYILRDYSLVDVSSIDWFPLVMMVMHIIMYSLGLGMVTTIVISEMFSASVKGKLLSMVNALYSLFSLAGTKYYQATADGFGLLVPFASFGFLSLLGTFFVWLYLPETKGKTLEEIQQRFKGKGKGKGNSV